MHLKNLKFSFWTAIQHRSVLSFASMHEKKTGRRCIIIVCASCCGEIENPRTKRDGWRKVANDEINVQLTIESSSANALVLILLHTYVPMPQRCPLSEPETWKLVSPLSLSDYHTRDASVPTCSVLQKQIIDPCWAGARHQSRRAGSVWTPPSKSTPGPCSDTR